MIKKIDKKLGKTLQRWGLVVASALTWANAAPARAQSGYVGFEFPVWHSDANTAWRWWGVSGRGIGVAVLDSGVAKHADLRFPTGSSSRVIADANFVPGAANANDECGHGTHVAGIIAGNGRTSEQTGYRYFYGIAPQARIVNVRVLDSVGQGTVSNVIAGIQWVIANRATHNIRVMNLSLGHPVGESYTTDPLCLAVEQAWKAGIVVVCAAGNNGRANSSPTAGQPNEGFGIAYGSVQSPANSPFAITVGAMKEDLISPDDWTKAKIATYSSRGPSRLDYVLKPDLVAPGNRIVSLASPSSFLAREYPDIVQVRQDEFMISPTGAYSTQYVRLSGTSMAAPVVAGAAALMLQRVSTLTPDTIKARLMASADKWLDPNGNFDPCTYGAGYLNIVAAINSTLTTNSFALSPTLLYNATTGQFTVDSSKIIWGSWGAVDAFKVIWGSTAVDGSKVIWGGNVLSGNKVIWGNHVLWGSQVWSNKVIWGSSNDSVDLSSVVLLGEW